MLVRIKAAIEKLEVYYQKLASSPYYALAIILQPDYRTEWFTNGWPEDRAEEAIHSAKVFWKKYRDRIYPLLFQTTVSSYDKKKSLEKEEIEKKKKKREQTEFDRIKAQRGQTIRRPETEDEYDNYCAETAYVTGMSALQWWQIEAQQNRWPQLSQLALEILSMPAMSAEPERIFSGGRRTMSWDRTKLSIETLEQLECQKNWIKQDFPKIVLEEISELVVRESK
jgi:hAT family C-terminal dimerisation region